ncbi:hypothetical protein ATO12_24265 [Aquimarina atlantica]|uniref:YhhN-like protein n=1 Tax=Aquimarina atlantica TaxID=1317122 RepID=A0A023BQ18_9FLAO|nr:lysoplasmalogenase family protein [Aquimarina atlantica]EZH72056.1 hypothetical protein ATO12_24265 [Aquimarina atlantica]
MNEGKLLKLLISFLIIIQVLGYVFQNDFLNTYTSLILVVLITALYFVNSKRIRTFKVIVLLIFFIKELGVFYTIDNVVKFQIEAHIAAYILLFYFLYYNHKSFVYNNRDVFTLVLGSSLFTIIFFMAYLELKDPMGEMQVLGFLYLLLIYVLLIVGAMHYINIRSEKSLWFFLSMLNFAFSDFMFLIDRFYLRSKELNVLMLICSPIALLFLVNYMITKSLVLKSEEFEGF